jgi:Caspase domain
MFTRLLFFVGLLVGAVFTISDARAERRIALVIGNSSYAHAQALRNPRNDANDLAQSLQTLGFEVLLGLDLDQQKFAGVVEQFARMLDGADVGLLFYAGHGLQINDKNYLVSVNAKLESEFLISSETLELDAIIKLMESKAATNLIFLDACRNNPLTENLRRNLAAMKRSASLGRGLARVDASGRDTLIAFAAAPGQEAADGSERNSPFTSALLKHLPKPGLEVSVMLKEVAADVRRDTRNAQRPQQLSDMTRTFYFAKAEPTPAVASAPPGRIEAPRSNTEDRTLEVAFWNAAQSANECDAIRAYLQRFPNGIFVELAGLSERRLCGQARRITVVEPNPAEPPPAAGAPPAMQPPIPAVEPSRPAPQGAVIAALPEVTAPTPESGAAVSGPELARNIQLELIRVGCTSGRADGNWGSSSKAAIRLFNKHARTKLSPDEPSPALLATLQEHDERVCPLQCERGFRASGNNCVAVQREPARDRRKAERESARDRRQAEREPPARKPRVERSVERSPADRPRESARPAPQPTSPNFIGSVSRPHDSPYSCFVDEGGGRRRPCDAGGRN